MSSFFHFFQKTTDISQKKHILFRNPYAFWDRRNNDIFINLLRIKEDYKKEDKIINFIILAIIHETLHSSLNSIGEDDKTQNSFDLLEIKDEIIYPNLYISSYNIGYE